MAIVNVKEFCNRTGFPLAMIRAYCREGKISHWKRGRVYLIDEDDAFGELKNLKDTSVYKRHTNSQRKIVERRKSVSGTFDYKAEIAKLQEQFKKEAPLDDKN